VRETFPDYLGSDNAGFGFEVPDLPEGPHRLRLTLVGVDGGTTVLERRIVVVRAPSVPSTRGPTP